MHLGVSNMPQQYKHVPKRPTQVLKLFSATLLPIDSGEALIQAGGKRQGYQKLGR